MKRNICFFKTFFVCVCILSTFSSQLSAQDDLQHSALISQLDSIDISLLTCTPHDKIYSLYGHTAIRVRNRASGDDVAINYGVFDPTAGWFVLRFIFGLTDYSMGICSYQDFLAEYRHFGSGVYEQHLNMNSNEKASFLASVVENSKPENVIYRYNYFYDNCTTRARDIILAAFTGNVQYKPLTNLQKGERSFRDLIHLNNTDHRWARLGNDLLLGFKADENTSHEDRQFLPQILANDFDSASIVMSDGSHKLMVDSALWTLMPSSACQNDNNPGSTLAEIMTPTMCSCIFFCVIMTLVVIEIRNLRHGTWSRKKVSWAHYFIYCLYAIPGIILFLMLFSQHPTVRLNFQIFIFCPLWLFLALPNIYRKWGRRTIFFCLAIFFLGNFFQFYAEGTNILALSLLTTFLPDYFANPKKISTFVR